MADGVNVVLTFRDEDGREWLAAAFMGPVQRYDEHVVAEECSVEAMKDRAFTLHRFSVVDPDPPSREEQR